MFNCILESWSDFALDSAACVLYQVAETGLLAELQLRETQGGQRVRFTANHLNEAYSGLSSTHPNPPSQKTVYVVRWATEAVSENFAWLFSEESTLTQDDRDKLIASALLLQWFLTT